MRETRRFTPAWSGWAIGAALLFYAYEKRRRGLADPRLWPIAGFAVAFGGIGSRLLTWDVSRQVSLADRWGNGDRSILAGLVGAWFGVHLGKRLTRYKESTGDLLAPAVALAMIIGGPKPSQFVRRNAAAHSTPQDPGTGNPTDEAPYDPLRLCIFATVALLGWLAGPAALAVFAGLGFAGYWKARRRGLARSKCFLRDTRLVLAYLGALLAAGAYGIYVAAGQIFGV
ncbi:hypothetical protein [Pseudarthrobacter sulfonivorans]|uniref:hypothetical protein n=1 Tax=Pseudarthrobacter sulfonivorans TaxID=121292 RepID=UPI002104852D|nr:hypothetical protein [Pseudarthrobacter sulfonivorans]